MKRKGLYSILSGFFFVIIAIVIVLGIIYYDVFITEVENTVKDDLNSYEVAKDVRNKLFFCYGNVIDTNKINESCNPSLIKGYNLYVIERADCEVFNYSSTEIKDYTNQFVYSVPVKQNNSICLGKMSIFI